jgi:tetratricopeptide (TPR) repeat protein
MTNLTGDLHALGRFDEAMDWIEKGIDIVPGYGGSYQNLASRHWLVNGRLDEAVSSYAKALSLDPENTVFLADAGSIRLDLGDPVAAEQLIDRSIELGPETFSPNLAMQLLHLYRGDETQALEHGRRAFALRPYSAALNFLRDHELRAGRTAEVLALYAESYPELLNERDPKVDRSNYTAAIGLALALSRAGEQQQADLLLDRSLEQIQTIPRLSSFGYGLADVRIHAIRGDRQKALSALRQAVDAGWRGQWWYHLERDLSLEPLHDEPEYQAMVAELKADMAAQLERVRELERNGELAPIPAL